MTEIQVKLATLQGKGWTLAAVADELEVAHNTVEKWKAGDRTPRGQKMIMASLDILLRRKIVPKQRRYVSGSRHSKIGGQDA